MSPLSDSRNRHPTSRLVALLATGLFLVDVGAEISSDTYPVIADSKLSVALYIDVANLAKSAGSDNATGLAPVRNFVVQLRNRLPNLPDSFEILLGARHDKDENDFRVHGVIPTTQYRNGHVTMCFSENGKALGAWKIYLSPVTYSDASGKPIASFVAGQIDSRPITPTTPDQLARGKSPCYGTMMMGISEIKADHVLAQQIRATPR